MAFPFSRSPARARAARALRRLIDVHLSTGSSFVIQRWATQQGGFWATQQWVTGDFDGNGLRDLAKAFTDGGNASLDVQLH